MTLEASLTFSSSESPDGLLSLSISALFSVSAAVAALVSLSAFSASLIAACFWISFAVGSRSSIFSGIGLSFTKLGMFRAKDAGRPGSGDLDPNQASFWRRPAALDWSARAGWTRRKEEWNAIEPKSRLGGGHPVGGNPGLVPAGEGHRFYRRLGDQRG